MICEECYSENRRITPLLNPKDCLQNHTQYICGACGRCICIEHDARKKLQRWNFPFSTPEIAKLYLRTADVTREKSCGIYELKNSRGRISYKIFAGKEDLNHYLKKNKDKTCKMTPIYRTPIYKTFPNTQIRRLTGDEVERYMEERNTKN